MHNVFKEYVKNNLLDRRQITWYEADIMSKPDERLRLVSIKLKKEDEDRFQMAMEDLKKMMLFRGQQDYEQSCTEMIEGLKKMISLTAETTGWIELPEGGRIRAGAMA